MARSRSAIAQDHWTQEEIVALNDQSQQLIDTAMGLANTGYNALPDAEEDTRACFRAIAHLLREAADHVCNQGQYLEELPAEENRA